MANRTRKEHEGQPFLAGMGPPRQHTLGEIASDEDSGHVFTPAKQESKAPQAWKPPHCGEALALETVDFSDSNRPKTCLEVDFPILPINRLAQVEGNAGKPIYQMSKWWARRRSSVFRSLLIAAATKAPDDPHRAGKLVWDAYYANHQKAGNFRGLRVLEPFMGGGTTIVEAARLGFEVAGCDLNPIAWFVCKNELAGTDPERVKQLFAHIEAVVKPQIQPFYTTTCPRGHRGRWIDVATGLEAPNANPITLAPEERARYRWEGAEVIYTFWMKHGQCKKTECQHRTPVMRDSIIAIKDLSARYIPTTCPHCAHAFRVFLGETRMAPGSQRVNVPDEPGYTETSRRFASLVERYGNGSLDECVEVAQALIALVPTESAFNCLQCHRPAGNDLVRAIEAQLGIRTVGLKGKARITRDAFDRKGLGIVKTKVSMTLCIDPRWLSGGPGLIAGRLAGGTVTSAPEDSAAWYQSRRENQRLIEIRGVLNDDVRLMLADGTLLEPRRGTASEDAHFTCQKCGASTNVLDAAQTSGHSPAVCPLVIQCHCHTCDLEGFSYGGRYFKAPEAADIAALTAAEAEWALRSETDLASFWPRELIEVAYMTHVRQPLPGHGYTHWWNMFNPRQRLGLGVLLKTITNAPVADYPCDVREQALGAFQQYLRNQNMFCFWDPSRDCMAPSLSNANYHPKTAPVENCFFQGLGRGNWSSCAEGIVDGLRWAQETWEVAIQPDDTSVRVLAQDEFAPRSVALACTSSTDLSFLGATSFDLVITDPPFGKNLFYADLADFFHVWLRIPLMRWYEGTPLAKPWLLPRTPHAAEAVPNPVETPDDREDWQKKATITRKHLETIRSIAEDSELEVGQRNPLYLVEPCDRRYREMLTEVWAECCRKLKPGGLMAFTFHHSEDGPWIDVLQALFDAGFVLVATYPVRSDETKGANAAFGSKKIEYDIVHVCRKRLEDSQPVAYLSMRTWVRREAAQLKALLDDSHRGYGPEGLPESDLRIILIGKSLEYYSRHYGKVLTGSNQVLGVKDALLGVNQLIDDLVSGQKDQTLTRVPDEAEPLTRLHLRLFGRTQVLEKNDCFKALKGTGYDISDLEGLGWARHRGAEVQRASLRERFDYLKARKRSVLRRDLDQVMFCAGCCLPGESADLSTELNNARLTQSWALKRAVLPILVWMSESDPEPVTREAASTAATLVGAWMNRAPAADALRQTTMFEALEQQAGAAP